MQSFQWDRSFETGIPDVDKQHKYLVELVNKYSSMTTGQQYSPEEGAKILNELTEYTLYHFQEEERMMIRCGIAGEHLREHIAAHKKFVLDLKEFVDTFESYSEEQSTQLLDFLINWLVYHILGSDQNMARQLDAIDKGMDPKQAFVDEEREHDEAVGPLLKALKAMFEQISERNKELILLNQSLEDKVDQRTQELSEANRKLEKLSLTDSLTQLPNRRYAMNSISQHWEEAKNQSAPLACMLLDVDLFKEVNDSAGHDAGDDLLKTLAATFMSKYREEDEVCRLGGDEFLVICPGLDLEHAQRLANTVLARVQAIRKQYNGYCWQGSVSIGVAELSDAMTNSGELIKAADESVYLAKESGKNCVRAIQAP
ncbi:bacteriohemerythrin [Vibrio sp. JC009]|uniref:bacteriohemerythrin n=1 Tax=Vibrio sp. JC009 TaxID=2912314 RepID=UPI0023B1F236|nr:bacteriohemerythrin [Vibrio sp. JC009]WED23980.1 bacteriohemerythrin [Vibrio sp. JC009]